MTDCTEGRIKFPGLNRKAVEVNFAGSELSSDGGALLIGAINKTLGLCKKVAKIIADTRNPKFAL